MGCVHSNFPLLCNRQTDVEKCFFDAIFMNDLATMEACLKNKVDINMIYICDSIIKHALTTPLTWACKKDYPSNEGLRCVQYLIQNNADVNKKDGHGRLPLSYATESGDYDLMKELISAGTHVKKDTALDECVEKSLLHWAVYNPRCMELLIQHGADVNALRNKHTPLIHAAKHCGNAECVKLLIKHGADLEYRDLGNESYDLFSLCPRPHNYTALFYALTERSFSTVEILLDAGANYNGLIFPDQENSRSALLALIEFGRSRSTYCCMYYTDYRLAVETRKSLKGHREFHNFDKCAALLIKYGCTPELECLGRYLSHGNADIFKQILDALTSKYEPDTLFQKFKSSPTEVSLRAEKYDCAKLLLEYGDTVTENINTLISSMYIRDRTDPRKLKFYKQSTKLMLDYGARVSLCRFFKVSKYHISKACKSVDQIRELLTVLDCSNCKEKISSHAFLHSPSGETINNIVNRSIELKHLTRMVIRKCLFYGGLPPGKWFVRNLQQLPIPEALKCYVRYIELE
ncbi:unnamed protein product [Owenia fusiformis]|uniref:Uncharacterized protein n=1 Tax=Owenia fusiformis TaxID=6347 RepID=A0A8J1UCS2_OWEFU|nr:unnamed protein product [Owenia fusiformis]